MMNTNDLNIFNESLNVLKERVSGFERIEEKDISHLQSEIDKINSELEALNSGLKQAVESNSENIKRLEKDIKDLTEKYQELKGEINQILLKFEYFRSEISSKDKKKNSVINNLIWPIIASLVVAFVLYVASGLNKISKMMDDSSSLQRTPNAVEIK